MLREGGVEVSESTARRYYYRIFPEKVRRRGGYLDRATRIRLFGEVGRLRRMGYSYGKIIEIVEKAYGVRLSKSHISGWLREIHTPFGGCRMPTIEGSEPSPDLAYVIGVICGEGYASRSHKRSRWNDRFRVGLKVKDEEFAAKFSQSLGRVLGRETPRTRRRRDGRLVVEISSKTLYGLLRKPVAIDRIRPFVGHCKECKASFLKGFFDSEGCVSRAGYISCINSDERLLEYVETRLNGLGIKTTGPHLQMKKGTPISDKRGQDIQSK